MDWSVIGAVGEIIGAAGVIASLLYLARQIREARTIAQTEGVRRITLGHRELNMQITTHPELSRIVTTGNLDPDALNEQEVVRYFAVTGEYFAHLTECRMAHDMGIMDDDYYEAWKRVYRIWLQYPGWQRYWEQASRFFPAATVRAIEGLGDPDETLVAAGAATIGIQAEDLRGMNRTQHG